MYMLIKTGTLIYKMHMEIIYHPIIFIILIMEKTKEELEIRETREAAEL